MTTRTTLRTRGPRRWRRLGGSGWGGDSGASVVELLGMAPLVVLLTLGTVQVGLWMHERQLVTAAAQEAAHAAAAADLTPGQATAVGEAAASRLLGDSQAVELRSVTVVQAPETATATVSAVGLSMIPGVDLRVTGVASSSVERFVGAP
ncbi:TadE/TadG family type IV pilus assembly protein [Aquipuribacter hungaricus]|uniref:TadE/TadG family type IV pilus assembly protein n=1 Tax=Aquipuribacter hungaricus TaxID=545624 RepID=A0ABV7WE00_9MICO